MKLLSGSLRTIDIESLRVAKDRAREVFGDIEALKESIKELGQITPLAVKEQIDEDTGETYYELVAGERRSIALKELGYKEIEVKVYPQDLSLIKQKCIELDENRCRKSFEWLEEATLITEITKLARQEYGEKRYYTDSLGISNTAIAKELGISTGKMSESQTLVKMAEIYPAEFKQVKSKTDALGLAKHLLGSHKRSMEGKAAKLLLAGDDELMKRANAYFVGDVNDWFNAQIANRAMFDLIEADPPYGIDHEKNQLSNKYAAVEAVDVAKDESYIPYITNLLTKLYQVTAANSFTLLWCDIMWFGQICDIAKSLGFIPPPCPIMWLKGHMMPQQRAAQYYMGSRVECCAYLRKGKATITPHAGNIFNVPPVLPKTKAHKHEKPVQLYEQILYHFVHNYNIKVASVFTGSGNCITAMFNMGLKHIIGVDKSPTYQEYYHGRVAKKEFKSVLCGTQIVESLTEEQE
jgi:ParB/RepB/Spo0J family partition protein